MIYDDFPDPHRIYRPLRGRGPADACAGGLSEDDFLAVVRVAGDHPRWGPRQIRAELRITGRDVPLAAVEAVADSREAS